MKVTQTKRSRSISSHAFARMKFKGECIKSLVALLVLKFDEDALNAVIECCESKLGLTPMEAGVGEESSVVSPEMEEGVNDQDSISE